MTASLQRGALFADAAKGAGIVDDVTISMLAAAERTGDLPSVLRQLATDAERRIAFRRSVALGLAYPGILLVLALFALPIKVLVFEGVGAYLAHTLPQFCAFVGGIVAFVWFIPSALARVGAPNFIANVVAALPVIGTPWKSARIVRFARTLGRLIDAGLPIDESLTRAAETVGHGGFARRIAAARHQLGAGTTLATAFRGVNLFDGEFLAIVEGSERTGGLATALTSLADAYEETALHRIRMTILIGTTLGTILVMGVIGYRMFVEYTGTTKSVESALDGILKGAGDVPAKLKEGMEQLDKLLD